MIFDETIDLDEQNPGLRRKIGGAIAKRVPGTQAHSKRVIDKAKKHMTHHWENTDIGIFVSHDLSQISELCKTCYIFSNGKNYAYGETKEMISLYEKEILNR